MSLLRVWLWNGACGTYPVILVHGESRSSLHVSFEELVGEMLREEGEHEVGALWVRYELPSQQELFSQQFHIGELLFTCGNNGDP